jgi:hypothetical protein
MTLIISLTFDLQSIFDLLILQTLPSFPVFPTCASLVLPYHSITYVVVQDSVITPEIAVDLMVACHSIGETETSHHSIQSNLVNSE